jgi:hypothetical protein
MAKLTIGERAHKLRIKKKTSDGSSPFSRPRNKHDKRNFKKYRGQGR